MPKAVTVVVSSLFPSKSAPFAGLFIRERMFRVARQMPIIIVSPRPWSPFDWAIRLFRPAFRPTGAAFEQMAGIDVYRPRYLSFPGIGKRFDGGRMAASIRQLLANLSGKVQPTLIDAHFLYPDGYAASIVAQELNLPFSVTIRGSKDQRLIGTSREFGLRKALSRADAVITVSALLRESVALPMGASPEKVSVIGNGVDLAQFYPEDKVVARGRLGLPVESKVMVTVGTLIGLKGFHRVVALMPALRRAWPNLHYLIVGGSVGHDGIESTLKALVAQHGLEDCVHFCGPQQPAELRWYYSAADVFVLATEYEGWANVLLEAMACGTPVVTTRVGGNAQVVPNEALGLLCEFWNDDEFAAAIDVALNRQWDQSVLLEYAREHAWEAKIPEVVRTLNKVRRQRVLNQGEPSPES
ncbi:MAG: glycosyltransferase [Burkholderiaceae bacterium]